MAAPALGVAPGRNGLIGVNVLRGGETLMWVVQPDGRAVTRMPVYGEGSFSPDGRSVALTRGRVLRVTDLDGANPRIVTRLADRALAAGAGWSPAGGVLYFESYDDGLFSVPTAGGAPRRITAEGADVDVSVTGRLAFEVERRAVPRVVTADDDGGDVRSLGPGTSPSWAPDGSRLAFARGARIMTAASDGTAATSLVDLSKPEAPPGLPGPIQPEITHVEWSPDGTQIAFVRRTRQDVLMILDLPTASVRRVLENGRRSFDMVGPPVLFNLSWQPLIGSDQIRHPVAPPPTGPCQLLGSRTILERSRARIFTEGDRDYGCLFDEDHRFRLKAPRRISYSWELGEVALAGRYAAYEYRWTGAQDGPFADVYVQDLRTGRIVQRANAIVPTPHSYLADVRRLVLSRSGSIAWVAHPENPDDLRRSAPPQLRILHAGRATTLDEGRAIRARSLKLRGTRLTWRHGRHRRAARLP